MGLDITAYKNIKQIKKLVKEDDNYNENYTTFYVNPAFPDSARSINSKHYYKCQSHISLHAGSYGGYNAWRNNLAKMAGYPLTEYDIGSNRIESCYAAACWEGATGPFSELINFSDCEGTLDHTVCQKLAKDFADFQEQANQFQSGEGTYWLEKYNKWREVFEFASENGAVEFH
jgi:hypothetical protein